MNKAILLSFIVLASMLVSCAGNRYSYKRKGEEVRLILKHENENTWPEQINIQSVFTPEPGSEKSRGVGTALLAPYLFRIGYNQVQKSLEHENSKRIASWSGFTSDDWFYLNTQKNAPVNLKSLTLIRTVQTGNSDQDTAAVVRLGLQRSWDGLFLRFNVERMKVNYAKAKLPLGDKHLDMDITLNMATYSVEKENSSPGGKIDPMTLTVYNIPLGKEMKPDQLKAYVSPWFPVIPRSVLEDGKYGTGNYSIAITVKEYAEYGEQVIKIDEKVNLGENKQEVFNLLEEIIKANKKEGDGN